jgi:hypothetical protein
MAETVFILGAGASYESGAPLMYNFFDKMGHVIGESEDEGLKDCLARVVRAVVGLESSVARVNVDTNNIESVLGLFEMAHLVDKQLVEGDSPGKPDLVITLDHLIAETIEKSLLYDVSSDLGISPHSSYAGLAELIRDIDPNHPRSCAVITLNYDCSLELALAKAGVPYCYSLPSEKGLESSMCILKLHGSLNWGHCRQEDGDSHPVMAYRIENYLRNRSIRPGQRQVSLPISHFLDSMECPECHTRCTNTPVIVPPSWNKTAVRDSLKPIWQQAVRELASAHNIYIIGYSMPETDLFFRDLLALGIGGGARIERFWVYDPSESVRKRYREDVVGPALAGRDRFRTEDSTFSLAVEDLRKRLGLDETASGWNA